MTSSAHVELVEEKSLVKSVPHTSCPYPHESNPTSCNNTTSLAHALDRIVSFSVVGPYVDRVVLISIVPPSFDLAVPLPGAPHTTTAPPFSPVLLILKGILGPDPLFTHL
jgi:hypothetical protein